MCNLAVHCNLEISCEKVVNKPQVFGVRVLGVLNMSLLLPLFNWTFCRIMVSLVLGTRLLSPGPYQRETSKSLMFLEDLRRLAENELKSEVQLSLFFQFRDVHRACLIQSYPLYHYSTSSPNGDSKGQHSKFLWVTFWLVWTINMELHPLHAVFYATVANSILRSFI